MSYNHDVKTKLCAAYPADRYEKECELYAYIHCLGSLSLRGAGRFFLMFETESSFLARRIFNLLADLFDTTAEIAARKNNLRQDRYSYCLIVTTTDKSLDILEHFSLLDFSRGFEFNNEITNTFFRERSEETGENIKGYLRGVFLASGYIGDPSNRNYQLEFVFAKQAYAADFIRFVMDNLGLGLRFVKRKEYSVVYTKNSETIIFLMAVIGAHSTVTRLEDAKISRQIRSDVVRRINCDMANVDKTIKTAERQIQAIDKINRRYTLKYLEPKLEELALLRLENREASLSELCQMYSPPKSRSTINNWFRKIEKIADKI